MRLATPEDFYDGPVYTHYHHHAGYARRAALLRQFPEPILIVGCGFGFLVAELLKLNRDAWGVDASDWAVANRVTDRVTYGNILLPATLPTTHFATLITEDLLPCLNDDEVRLAARNCASLSTIVLHAVTITGQAQLNYHSLAEWTGLTGQLTFSLEGL